MTIISFTERMDEGRANAASVRYKGGTTGAAAKGWNTKRRVDVDAASWEWLCRSERDWYRRRCKQIRNDFAAACLNPINDQPETWEFH